MAHTRNDRGPASTLTLPQKLAGLCGTSVLALALVSFVSYRALVESDGTGRIVAASHAQRAQMDADMMHDALRADVQALRLALDRNDLAAVTNGTLAIRAHSARLRQDFVRVASNMEPGIQRAVQDARPLVDSYADAVEAVAIAAERSQDLQPKLREFDSSFARLEQQLEQLGDALESCVQDISDQTQLARKAANRRNLLVSGLGGLGLALLSLLFVRSIRAPLLQMARAARHVAEGDVEQRIEYRANDELGRLADALRGMIEYIQSMTSAAEALGRGDLAVQVRARSRKDTLARGFLEMKTNLERSIQDSNRLLQAVQRGDLSARCDPRVFSGVFRDLVEGANGVLEAVSRPFQEAKEVLASVAQRDLSARMRGEYTGDYASIKSSLNEAVTMLEDAMREVIELAVEVANKTQRITSGNTELARTAGAQVQTLGQVTTALSQTTTMSERNAQTVQSSRSHAEDAMKLTEHGANCMERLSCAVEEMKNAADESAKIVRTIDEVAFQTNLLALNAAVEAARAGEAGRGFAVVAEEVRKLAMRSAEAARSTTQVIQRSLQKVEEGVAFNRDASVAFLAISEQIGNITGAMAEIDASSRQQHSGVARLSESVESVMRDARSVADTARNTARDAEALAQRADTMRVSTESFQLASRGGSAKRAELRAVATNRRSVG
ncbi:MAG TPA: methyl-accepting chemotaxis protein [Polyangiaceae bacterium]|nr:methyl-accepting chemotaxis protein [Polyangiaceae bacterium]